MPTPKKVLLFLLACHFLSMHPSAQTLDWEFEVVEMPGGAGGNKVQMIIQDRQGYLWIGSQNGLYRYDGKSFRAYLHNPADTNSIGDDYIDYLYEDSEGDIWIGTVGNGVSRFDPLTENFTRYYHEILDQGSGKHTLVNSIAEDKEGNIWIASLSGLSKYNRKEDTFKKYRHDPNDPNSLSHDLATLVYCDKAGTVWVGTGFYWFSGKEGGLNQYVPEKDHFIHFTHDPNNEQTLSHNTIWSIVEDQEGRFWVGTGGKNGLHLMNRSKGTFTRFEFDPDHPEQLSAPNIKSAYQNNSVGLRRMLEDQQGQLWLLTFDRALGIYNLETQKGKIYATTEYDHPNIQVPSSKLFNIFQAKDGSIWLSTGTSMPVIRALPRNTYLKYVSLEDLNIENAQIAEIFESKHPEVWLGLTQGRFARLDAELNLIQSFHNKVYSKEAPSAGKMRVIFEDQSDKIWIGISNKIEHFDLASQRFNPIHIPLAIQSNVPTEQPIFALNHDAKGNYWIGTLNWGLLQYTPQTKAFKHFHPSLDSAQYLSNRSIADIFLGHDNQLWVTGGDIPLFVPNLDSGFLDQWSEEKKQFIPHLSNENQKILGRMPVSIEQTKDGTLWFVSWGGGLHAYNPSKNRLDYFNPAQDNFPDWDTRWLVLDKKKNLLWIGTRHDVYQFDPLTFEYQKYALFTGRPGESDHGKAIMQASGKILFAWGNGLYQFDPRQYEIARSNWKAPTIRFADLYVNEKKIDIGKKSLLAKPLAETSNLTLNYTQNQFGVEIHNFHFKNPELNRVEYKLEPYDSRWRTLDNTQLAQYQQVQPGAYTLSARGYSSEGLESDTISLSIRILPPWWRSNWAYLAYLGLFIVALLVGRRQIINREKLKSQLKLEQLEKEKVQEIDQVRARFFANISHEFRTPLTLIKAPLEDLLTSKRNPQDRLTFLRMHQNTERLLHLVNQLLDLSRLESGVLKLHFEKIEINRFLRQLAGNFQSLADQKQVDLQIQVPQEKCYVNADQDKIEKIVLNLLSNAIKFAPEKGWVKLEANFTNVLQLSVANNGTPIPAEEQDRIFDRFYQAGNTRHQGAGIGLALVREFVELHHGRLGVSSSELAGTTFWVELPLEIMPETKELSQKKLYQPTPLTATKNTPAAPTLSGMVEDKPVLLLVEDHEEVRLYIREKLLDHFKVFEAANGQQGLEKAIEILPDLIISDVMMPIMDGVTLCHQIKKNTRTDHIPVILLTAKADIESRLLGLQTGADDYLAKPFNNTELLLRSQNLILQRQKLRQRYQQSLQLTPVRNGLSKAEAQFIQKAINIIEANLESPDFTAEDFARNMHMSRQHLHRKLKAITGMSATDFIRNLRLEKAAVMLGNGTKSVAEVAYQVGFNNLSYFSKCFKKKYDQSPSDFLKGR